MINIPGFDDEGVIVHKLQPRGKKDHKEQFVYLHNNVVDLFNKIQKLENELKKRAKPRKTSSNG